MYIRCPSCKASTRMAMGRLADGAVTCSSCGRKNSTEGASSLGATPDQRHQRALEFSQSNGIDLASAYSVLLGIMPLEDALSFENGRVMDLHPAGRRNEKAPVGAHEAAAAAVAPAPTSIRTEGERAEPVRRIMTPLRAQPETDERKNVLVWRLSAAAAAFVVIGICVAAVTGAPGGFSGRDAAADSGPNRSRDLAQLKPSVPTAAAEIRVDAGGQPVYVMAQSPERVLAAFCGASSGSNARVPEKVARLGDDYVGYYGEGGIRYAVRIIKVSGGFSAGSISEPIRPTKASAAR